MPSTDCHPTPRNLRFGGGSQRGLSLIEALVASALLGLAAVAGITAWDTAIVGARTATHKAWAVCMGRSAMEAALAGADTSQFPNVMVSPGIAPSPAPTGLQLIRVVVNDPDSHAPLYTVSALRSSKMAPGPTPDTAEIDQVCPTP